MSWALTGVGAAASIIGAVKVRAATPRCKNFDLKVQFAASDQRLARWLKNCSPDLDSAKRALRWDYLLLTGYGMLGAGAVASLSRRTGGLPAWLAGLPVAAAAADVVEDILLTSTLEVRDNRFAFPIDSARPALVTVAASTKFLFLGCTVLVIVVSAAKGKSDPTKEGPPFNAEIESAVFGRQDLGNS